MAAVVITTNKSVRITIANTVFLWLIASLLQVDETQCAVPIDVKVEVVTATKKPPRSILHMIPDAYPLISHHRRDLQKPSQSKPGEEQVFAYLLQGYNHPKYSHRHPNDESIYDKYDGTGNHKYSSDITKKLKPGKTMYKKLNSFIEDIQHRLLKKLMKASNEKSNYEETPRSLSNPLIQEVLKKYVSRYKGSMQKNNNNKFYYKNIPGFINMDNLWYLQRANNYETLTDDSDEVDDVDVSQNINQKRKGKSSQGTYGKSFSDIQKLLSSLSQIRSKEEDDVSDSNSNMENSQQSSEEIFAQQKYISGNKYRYRRATTSREMHNQPDYDFTYWHPSWWPEPSDGIYDPEDPRNPDHPLHGNGSAEYRSARFENDDYQPFLGLRNNPYPQKTLPHGTAIFLSQAIPMLKSMIMGKGIEHSPYPNFPPLAAPFRVAWQDIQHYNEPIPMAPEPGPRSYRRHNPKTQQNYLVQKNYGHKKRNQINNEDEITDSLASYRRKAPENYLGFKTEVQKDIIEKSVRVLPENKIRVYWQQVTTTAPSDLNTLNTIDTSNKTARAEEKRRAPKRIHWWPKRKDERSIPKKNKFVFDKNKNYTIILRVY